MRRRFARVLALLLCAALAGMVFGSAPLRSWAEGHRATLGETAVALAAGWHGAMQAAGLDRPYAAIRRAVRRAIGD
jgi:hypothetical protein